MRFRYLMLALPLLLASPAFAAAGQDGHGLVGHGLDGRTLSLLWALPFLGLLLSIATGPMLFHHLWENHYGKIATLWAALTLVPLMISKGWLVGFEAFAHVMLLEYVSFIVLLFTLFTVAGGIWVNGNLHGSPALNTGLLALGTVLASIVGTTGASMILIRPMIRANDERRHNVHVVVFFIFLVSNIGGALTPLGDPPLFLGFLKGVEFFWTAKALGRETALLSLALLAIFFVIDTWLYRSDSAFRALKDKTPDSPLRLSGLVNVALLVGVIGAILGAAAWKPGIAIPFPGGVIELQNLVRDVALLGIALLSLKITPQEARDGNAFNWGPILEVAKLFAGIFVCMIPVMAMLKAGEAGAFAPLVSLVTQGDGGPNNTAYFWLTGLISAFLDNAPTYLVFFELAGGDAKTLMGPLAPTLAAISMGAVFMGALTYIGNAPNLMVAVIARDMGVKMPGFFGYLVWSFGILGPLFAILWWLVI